MKCDCYFFINDVTKCVFGKKHCWFCSYKIKPIKGMDKIENMKDYVGIVASKSDSKRAFWVSIIATLISLFALFINYVDARDKLILQEQLNLNNSLNSHTSICAPVGAENTIHE